MLNKQYLPLEKALELLLFYISFRCLPPENIPIEESYGRIVYEDIISPEDLPGFDKSTVDGFAVRAEDTFGAKEGMPVYLTVKGEVQMGKIPNFSLNPGECASISTGGMLPEGANAVIMIEHVNIIDENLIEILKPVSPGENVIFKDEDIKKGEVVFKAGHKLRPQDVGALAGLGITEIKVVKKPKVAIILTGDEIVPHNEKVTPGKVRDINSFTLKGLIKEHGGIPIKIGIVKDEYSAIKKATEKALNISDIVLITGGTSAGVKDLTMEIINESGHPGVIFHGVSMKPGKPIIAGVCNGKPVFGLPGHPVAVYICFKLFVKPVIEKMLGITQQEYKKVIRAKIERSLHSQAGRTDYIRVYLKEKNGELWAIPLLSKSGLIMSLAKADGIITIPSELLGIEKGEMVEVELIS